MPTQKIRIAQVVRPATGGIRTHLATILAHFDREAFEMTLFAPADFADFAREWQVLHVPLEIAPRNAILNDSIIMHELAQHLRSNFDLIHAHGVRAAYVAAQATYTVRLPLLFTAHNLVPRLNPFSRLGLNITEWLCSSIIAVSESISQSLQKNGLNANKIHVIPNGVDVTPFDAPFDAFAFRVAQNIPPDAALIVAVGRLSPEKGFDVLIRAFSQIQQSVPNVRLILVGDGPERNNLQKMAANNPAILFTGFVENVVPFLKIADVVAIPSRQEGQGIVALEAMAASRPVVASRVGGLVETIIENEMGLLVPPENAPALAEALTGLLKDSSQRFAMGKTGRLRVEQVYSAQKLVAILSDLYVRDFHPPIIVQE